MNNQLNTRGAFNKKSNRPDRSSFGGYADEDDDMDEKSKSSLSGLGNISDFYKMFEDTIKDVSTNVGNVKEVAGNLLREHPFYAILGAAAVGFAAGTAIRSGRTQH